MVRSLSAPGVQAIVQGRDDNKRPIFSVLVKRTYDINRDERLSLAQKARPFVQNDHYYDEGDPEWATVKYETEFAAFKFQTDVVVIGSAYAPEGKPVQKLDVSVEVESQRKALCVFGDRRCIYRKNANPEFTAPLPFTEMPLRYERAYGGKDTKSAPETPFFYPRNHTGTGFVIANKKESMEDLALPNIEDPEDLLTPERIIVGAPENWSKMPLPDGLGWFQRTWYPRCSFVGAMPAYLGVDTPLREEQLGLVPKGQVGLAWQYKLPSFDLRFNNGASRGLRFSHLNGTEKFRLTHLTPTGLLAFQLPGDRPSIRLDLGQGENELESILDTVLVRLEEMQVDLIWRGTQVYPGIEWLPEMRTLVARVA